MAQRIFGGLVHSGAARAGAAVRCSPTCDFIPQDALLRLPSHFPPHPLRASAAHEIPARFSKDQTRSGVPHKGAGSCSACTQAGRQRKTTVEAEGFRGLLGHCCCVGFGDAGGTAQGSPQPCGKRELFVPAPSAMFCFSAPVVPLQVRATSTCLTYIIADTEDYRR